VAVACLVVLATADRAAAEVRVWDAEGATESFSEVANWSGDVAPGPRDVARVVDVPDQPGRPFVVRGLPRHRVAVRVTLIAVEGRRIFLGHCRRRG